MISTALEYAKRLRELNIPGDIVGQTGDIFKAVPQVKLDFESPAVSLSAKHNVIEKVFPLQIRDFLKVLCDNGDVYLWDDICTAYREFSPEKKGEFVVTLSYVTAPTDEQLQNIRNFIRRNTTERTWSLRPKKTFLLAAVSSSAPVTKSMTGVRTDV